MVVVRVWQHPISLICMSSHKASATRWLTKPPSHIRATCHPGIATVPFKKARPKCALHYHDYQLPDHLYNSSRISNKRHTSMHLRAVYFFRITTVVIQTSAKKTLHVNRPLQHWKMPRNSTTFAITKIQYTSMFKQMFWTWAYKVKLRPLTQCPHTLYTGSCLQRVRLLRAPSYEW